jgi:hypothetical protein
MACVWLLLLLTLLLLLLQVTGQGSTPHRRCWMCTASKRRSAG